MTRTETQRLNELIKTVRGYAKRDAAQWTADDWQRLEKKPYILQGRGVRNWDKKTPAEKIKITRSAYIERGEKAAATLNELATQADALTEFTARVEWHRSATWGYNPTANTWTRGTGRNIYGTGKASGCGYDKLSAAINSALNTDAENIFLSAIIKSHIRTGKPLPYGVHVWGSGISLNFGGCGVETLTHILEYCGLKARHISGNMFDYVEASR